MEQRIADYRPRRRINTNLLLPCGGTRVACESRSRHGCLYSKNVRRDRLVRSHPDRATHATPPPNRHERDFLSHTPISARNFHRFVGRDQKTPAATKTFVALAGMSPATDLIPQPTSPVSILQP